MLMGVIFVEHLKAVARRVVRRENWFFRCDARQGIAIFCRESLAASQKKG